MGNCLDCPDVPPPSPNPSSDEFPLPNNEKVKFLLLGAGESGKSTLFKQMRINYVRDYDEEQLIEEKTRIQNAFFATFKIFVEGIMKRFDNIISENTELDNKAKQIFIEQPSQKPKMHTKLTPELKLIMEQIWTSKQGQIVWEHHSDYSITDSFGYFCENLDRITALDYKPTEMDFLRTRIVTLGISQQTFNHKGVQIEVVDVGGQRSERTKWLLCFDGVTSVIFVASISEFDQKLYEDSRVNRIDESLELFKKSTNFLVFRETPFVLFLNKQDLLEEKLERLRAQDADLDEFFPTLKLGKNYKNALDSVKQYYKEEFTKVVKHDPGRVITHFVTATDKDTFKRVFQAAAQVVLRQALKDHFLF